MGGDVEDICLGPYTLNFKPREHRRREGEAKSKILKGQGKMKDLKELLLTIRTDLGREAKFIGLLAQAQKSYSLRMGAEGTNACKG